MGGRADLSPDTNAHCPRCGSAFHCGATTLTGHMPCACSGFTLSPDTTRLLRERYGSCLCVRCLAELAGQPPGEKKPAQP